MATSFGLSSFGVLNELSTIESEVRRKLNLARSAAMDARSIVGDVIDNPTLSGEDDGRLALAKSKLEAIDAIILELTGGI